MFGELTSPIGILAITDGPVKIKSSTINTTGDDGLGIFVEGNSDLLNAKATIDGGDIHTRGAYAHGIQVFDRAAIDITSGKIAVDGYMSHGIVAAGTTGKITISAAETVAKGTGHDTDLTEWNSKFAPFYGTAIAQRALSSDAITALSTSGDISITSGTASMADAGGAAILAVSTEGGAVNVKSSQVTSTGVNSAGILASGGSVTIDSGVVSSAGVGITTQSTGATIIKATDTTAGGSGAFAILAQGAGAVSIDSGKVVSSSGALQSSPTTAFYAGGISAVSSTSSVIVKSADVLSTGLGGLGLVANGATGAVVNSGKVVTTGGLFTTSGGLSFTSAGIASTVTGGNIDITSGAVSTQGRASSGIFAWAQNGGITIKSGEAATAGDGSAAINATAKGDIVITSDKVSTVGAAANVPNISGGVPGVGTFTAHGIVAQSSNGAVTVRQRSSPSDRRRSVCD